MENSFCCIFYVGAVPSKSIQFWLSKIIWSLVYMQKAHSCCFGNSHGYFWGVSDDGILGDGGDFVQLISVAAQIVDVNHPFLGARVQNVARIVHLNLNDGIVLVNGGAGEKSNWNFIIGLKVSELANLMKEGTKYDSVEVEWLIFCAFFPNHPRNGRQHFKIFSVKEFLRIFLPKSAW